MSTDKRHQKAIEKKLLIAEDLFRFAYETKRYQLRLKFPTLTEREINHKAYALIEKGCK
jgi:hypothetical protein